MRRHKKRNDVILLAVDLEVGRVMAVVTVENQKVITAYRSRLCMLVKVLDPSYASLVGGPAVVKRGKDLIFGQWAVLVPRHEVIFAFDDNKRRDRPAKDVDSLDYGNPFTIPRLLFFRPATTFYVRNYHRGRDKAHQKVSLVKVVHICLYDAVFRNCVSHKSKPATSNIWIFA